MLKLKFTTAQTCLGAIAALLMPTTAVFGSSYIDLGMVRGDTGTISRVGEAAPGSGVGRGVYAYDAAQGENSGQSRALVLAGAMIGFGALAWLAASTNSARHPKGVE